MMREGFPWVHIAVVAGLFALICWLLDVWHDVIGYFLLIAAIALFIYMAKRDWIAWLPIAATGLLMYLSKITNIGVTHYNIFLLSLLVWSAFLVFFYRQLSVRRRKNAE
jgi:hypothetical protein